MQKITQTGPATFTSEWTEVPNDVLTMTFNDLIGQFKLTGSYCLLHWQAKPVGLRKWGVYDSTTDQYHSCDWDKLVIQSNPRILQIDERRFTTKPTAVLLFSDAQAMINSNGSLSIQGNFRS